MSERLWAAERRHFAIADDRIVRISRVEETRITRRQRCRQSVQHLPRRPEVEDGGRITGQCRQKRKLGLVLPLIDVVHTVERVLSAGSEEKDVEPLHSFADGELADEVPERRYASAIDAPAQMTLTKCHDEFGPRVGAS